MDANETNQSIILAPAKCHRDCSATRTATCTATCSRDMRRDMHRHTEPVTLDFLDFNLKYLVNEKELLYNKGVAPDQRVEIYSKMR